MGYGETLVNGFKVLLLDKKAMNDLAKGNTVGHGFLTLAIYGLIIGLIPSLLLGGLLGPVGILMEVLMSIVWAIVGFIVGYSIYHFLAKIFGGKASGGQFFAVMANFMVVYWAVTILGIIPYLGALISVLVGLWSLVVLVFVLMNVHQLETWKAVVVMLIPIVVLVLIGFLLGGIAVLSALSNGGMMM